MPIGVRMTVVFLRVMLIALIVPVMSGALSSLIHLGIIFGRHASPLNSLLLAGLNFGVFLAFLATAIACEWMVRFLRARHSPPDLLPRPIMPAHPAIQIGLPLLRGLGIYSILALLAWLVAVIGGFAPINWAWLVSWLIAGCGSFILCQTLKKRGERKADG